MELLYTLLVLLAVTRLCGEVAIRVRQPALVGELIGGILVGVVVHAAPDAFPTLNGLSTDAEFSAVTDLGVFFLMLLAGMELQPRELVRGSGTSFCVALGGMLLPLGLGLGLGYAFLPVSSLRFPQALFLGTAVAITAVPVAIKVLLDLGQLESRIGKTIVAAALIDDILSLMLLSVLTALITTGSAPDALGMVLLGGKVLLFFVTTTALGIYVLPRIAVHVRGLLSDEVELSLLVLVALAFAVLAEMLHMHFIIGAFVAGLFFSARTLTHERFEAVRSKICGLTKGLLAPIFFASIGLRLELGSVTGVPVFLLALITVAIVGKLVGAGLAARLMGLPVRDSTAIGMAMSARGAVELIIADIAMEAGLFATGGDSSPVVRHMFSAVVVMAIVTTLITPVALRWILRSGKATRELPQDAVLGEGRA